MHADREPTLAGTAGMSGNADGTGAAARFLDPSSIAVNGAGDVFVADKGNHTIRKITSVGVVTTLAGSAGSSGSANGTGTAARFDQPAGVGVDGAGNVFVADTTNDTIRKITPAGVVTTVAGAAGAPGSANGLGPAARFDAPSAIVVDGTGQLFVTDAGASFQGDYAVRKITAAGAVTTLAGSASEGASAANARE